METYIMSPIWKKNVLSLAGFVAFLVLAVGSTDSSETRQGTQSAGPREEALRAVKLDFSWSTGGFGSIMKADFTIVNPTPHTIKDIEITCVHFAPSGTKIDSNRRTIYERIPPNAKKRVKGFDMGFIHSQAKSSSCSVTDLVVEP